MKDTDHQRLATIGFDDFRAMARDPSLTPYEKIGADARYRQGHEEAIFADILARLPALSVPGTRVLDIGPGCSDLPRMLIAKCAGLGNPVALVDSAEMLALLPDGDGIDKVAARFPDCDDFCRSRAGRFDVVLVYSVFHYVFMEGNPWKFLDQAMLLLAPGGSLLVGDVPNVSKRKRFFASDMTQQSLSIVARMCMTAREQLVKRQSQ